MNFKRFEHVNLNCRDLDATRAFYQRLFPDWVVRAEGEANGIRWMHLGNPQFYLSLNETPEATRSHQTYSGIGINHVGFVIDDSDAITALLQANGLNYYTYISPETRLRIYVDDPDGNEIELVEYNPDYPLK